MHFFRPVLSIIIENGKSLIICEKFGTTAKLIIYDLFSRPFCLRIPMLLNLVYLSISSFCNANLQN